MTPKGIALSALLILAPLIWLPGIAQGRDVVALFSQYLGLVALIAMAISQVIATRWPGVEAAFGPLDQGYRLHKWLGIGSMAAILLHDTIDAEMRGLGRETALVELAETLGEISLYGLLILVVITIATFIPYHLWKWTHRLIGVFFVFGAFHYLFILKPFANSDPLGLYMAAVCGIGLVAYVYTSAPRGLRPSRAYDIQSVTQEGDAVAIEMAPKGAALQHRPGQFAFFAFTGAGFDEPHPFTISSAPADTGHLRITVAPLGDLTSRLGKAVAAGQALRVDGAYGRFGENLSNPQVWVAAGIGITPFLAMAHSLAKDGPPVHLVYAVRSTDKAAHLDEITEVAANTPRLTLHLWESNAKGRLSAEDVATLAGADLSGADVRFCGPSAMRKALADGLAGHGVSARRFHYEEFEIRTGLGFRRLANWMWEKRLARAS